MKKETRSWFPFLIVLQMASWGLLVGCVPGTAPLPAPTAPETIPPSLPTALPAAATVERPTAVPLPSAAPSPPAYQQVEVSTLGLALEVPADWVRLDPEWAWAPTPEAPVRLGLRWAEVEPPAEVTAVLLPQPAVVQGAEPLDTSWGRGQLYTVAVYDPSGQGLVRAVEEHAIIVIVQNGTRWAYDLYASAPSDEALAALRPLLRHMVESSTLSP